MSKLIKDSSIYLLSTIIKSGIPFFLLPILTRHLSKEDFGIMSLYGTFINFGLPLVGLAISVPLTKQFFYYSKEKYSSLVSSALTLWSYLSIISAILLLLFLHIANYNHFPIIFGFIISFHILLSLIRDLAMVIIRNNEKPLKYAFFHISGSIIEFTLIWYFIVLKDWNWQGKVTATILSIVIVDIVHLYLLRKTYPLKLNLDKKVMKDALSLSLPLIPNLIAVNIINLSDRLFLIKYHGEAENGLYSLAAQFASLVLLFNTAVGRAFIPWIFKSLSNHEYQKVYKSINQYTLLLFLVTLTIPPLSYLLLKIGFIDSKFEESLNYVWILSIALGFFSASNISNNILINQHETKRSAKVYILGGIFCIILNFILIPQYGIMGASVATLLTCLFLFAGIRYQIKKII